MSCALNFISSPAVCVVIDGSLSPPPHFHLLYVITVGNFNISVRYLIWFVGSTKFIYRGAYKSLAQLGMKEATYIHRILWNLEVHYHVHNSPPPVSKLGKSIHLSAHHTFVRRSLFPSWSG